MATFFVVKSVCNFHHTMLVLNAFLAISEGLIQNNSKLAAQFSLRQPKLPPPPLRRTPPASSGPSPRWIAPPRKKPGYVPAPHRTRICLYCTKRLIVLFCLLAVPSLLFLPLTCSLNCPSVGGLSGTPSSA